MESFSTENLDPKRRLVEWNNHMSQRLTAVDIDARREFTGNLVANQIGEAVVLSIKGDATTIQSSADGARRHNSAARYSFIFHDRRPTQYRANGREAVVGEGDFILLDLQTHFWASTIEDDKRLTILHLPTSNLLARAPEAACLNGLTGSARSGSGAILRSFMNSCLSHCDGVDMRALEGVICDLASLVVAGMASNDDVEADLRNQLREEAIRLIDRNLNDPDLNTGMLAQRLGVSPRYVQMIFADITQTPTAFIRGRRLDAVRKAITQTDRAKITDIAFDHGFSDLSQFNRAFKARFGITPSKLRRAHF